MIGVSIYTELAGAALFITLAAKQKSRVAGILGIFLFACALATLGVIQMNSDTLWLAVLYWIAAMSQAYVAIRTWKRWPKKSDADETTRHK